MEVIFTAPWGSRLIKTGKEDAPAEIQALLDHASPDDVVRVDVEYAAYLRGDPERLWEAIRFSALNTALDKLAVARTKDEMEVIHNLLSVARRAEKRQVAVDGGGEDEIDA